MKKNKKGFVSLTGAGPGDEGLITLKAVNRLKSADIVFYDFLANKNLLKHCSKKCQKIYVGKRSCHDAATYQRLIEKKIIDAAKKGLRVVRLKGGDPFIFGRGGEEAQSLVREGIEFEIIPGVTSAISVPAYAGIPLTHRDYSSSVAFVTGHESYSKSNHLSPDWKALSKMGTLVFLMGATRLKHNMASLMKCGMNPSTPCAMISWGTYAHQRQILGTIKNIDVLAVKNKILPPSIVVVGRVADLSKEIGWYNKMTKPLSGKSVVVTRTKGQASEFSRLLKKEGANVIEIPSLEMKLVKSKMDCTPFDVAIFTSQNGVSAFLKNRNKLGSSCRIIAVGEKTAALLVKNKMKVSAIPQSEFTSSGIVALLKSRPDYYRDKNILVVRGKGGKTGIEEFLKSKKATVSTLIAYEMKKPESSAKKIAAMIKSRPDWLTFLSAQTFENFVSLVGSVKFKSWSRQKGFPKMASIGPVTSRSIRDFGMRVDAEAKRPDLTELAAAMS